MKSISFEGDTEVCRVNSILDDASRTRIIALSRWGFSPAYDVIAIECGACPSLKLERDIVLWVCSELGQAFIKEKFNVDLEITKTDQSQGVP